MIRTRSPTSEISWLCDYMGCVELEGWLVYLIKDHTILIQVKSECEPENKAITEDVVTHRIFIFFSKQYVRKMPKPSMWNSTTETWMSEEFFVNPVRVPHRLLTEYEKKIRCLGESWDDEQEILVTDIVARYYNAKPGDVFEIIRNRNPKIITYRVVVIPT